MSFNDSAFTISEEGDTENMCLAEKEWGIGKYNEGFIEGFIEGYEEGLRLVAKLVNTLLSENRLEDAKRAAEDKEYRERLMREFNLEY